MRYLALSLIAVAVVFGLTTVAQQQAQPAQPVTEIKIVPEKPTLNDKITVELSGTFPNGCAPDSAEATVELNQVTIHTSNAQEFCAEGQTAWKLSVPVPTLTTDGKKLEAGPYRVVVLFSMGIKSEGRQPEEYLLLGMKRFDVTGGGGALGDQAGQPGSLVPFTVSVQNQSRSPETSVPGPLFVSTIKSSKSNLDNRFSQLPGTAGLPKGDVVTLTVKINTVRSNTFRIVGCQVSDVKIIDDCTRPPIEEVKLEITGDDPILTFQVEQIEPPDLAVRITATVRRYTEREQVYCDVTVLTTVQNLGKGPSGAVLLSVKINTMKLATFRYGMGSGEQATQTDATLTRLRPGTYPLEAEVQSLSMKESNTANNKVTQAVMCR